MAAKKAQANVVPNVHAGGRKPLGGHVGHTITSYGDYTVWCETEDKAILPEDMNPKGA